jgi:ribosomal protein L28
MRHCELCGKTSRMVGTRKLLRGHYNPTNWSRKYPNLQKTKTPSGEKALACTNCIKTFSKKTRMADNKKAREAATAVKVARKAAEAAKPKPVEKAKKVKKEKPAKEAK